MNELPSILGNLGLKRFHGGHSGFFHRLVKSKTDETTTQITPLPSGTNGNESYIDEVCGNYLNPLKEHLADRESQIVDATKAFLPHIMLQDETITAGSATVMRRCIGCLVYANATGVTQLAETLAQRPGGAEVLSKCLNKFFTPLIDIIQAYRGDVIKFNSDALYIFFEATDDYRLHLCPCGSPGSSKKTPEQLACLRACACSLEIHKRLHEFDTGEGGARLSLHCCIATGKFALLQVGGEQRRFEYVIAGTPMEQIALAEPCTSGGDTVVSPQAWSKVDDTLIAGVPLTHGPPGFQRLLALDTRKHTYPTVKQAAIDCSRVDEKRRNGQMQTNVLHGALQRIGEHFIPRAVLKHLSSGNHSSINEMRLVTVIFVQIGGVDVSSDEGAEITQKLMVSMQKACYAQEGNLNKFLVDHQGLLFLFVFGLPPVVHIDDPLRAVTCCWDMVSVLKSMGLDGRLGVSTGRVFCGILGSVKRCEYTVMGETVNRAARLMSAANKNAVLIDEATFLRSEHDVVCKRLDAMKIKGMLQPIKVFAPICPEVHGLEVGQLAGLLNHRSWNLEKTRIQVKLPEPLGKSMIVDMPWRASSQLLGGMSPMLKLNRWRELGKVSNMLQKDDLGKGLLEVGGSLMLLGLSGIGKQEIAEYIVHRSVDAQFIPLFGVMRSRANMQWQAVAELIQHCLRTLYEIHQSTAKAKVAKSLEDEAEKLLQKFVSPDAKLRQVLAFLGFEGFEVPSERNSGETTLADDELEVGAVEVAVTLVKAVAETHPVMVMLRIRRGTDIFDGLGKKATNFWRLSAELNQVGLKRRQDINAGALMKPIFVVTISRKMPDASNMKAGLSTDAFHSSLPKPTRILMSYLTEDAAVELMCHCLGLSASDGGLPIKRALRDFVMAVTINVPTYIQECMHHLLLESWLKVSGGECIINSPDLNDVNVAGWVDTNMVGSMISQLESLTPEMQNIINLATILEGAFSPLDIAAANRFLFGRLPSVLAFHDQARLLKICGELVKQGILRPVVMSQRTLPADKLPSRLPRWTIANSLVRKVAGSMVLSSYRSMIKRAVLIERALNVELPQRIGLKRRGNAGGTFRTGRSNRLGKRVLRRTRGLSEMSGTLAQGASTPVANGISLHDSPFPEMQLSTSPKAEQEAMEMLFTAAVLGNLNVVLDVLSVNPDLDLDASTDAGGYTPVHFACSSGEVDVVHLLCESAASVSVLSDKSETPLLIAAQRGHLEVVQYLCETQSALRVSPDLQSVEYWEKALSEVNEEVDIPGFLSPAFGGPSLTQDTLNEKRKSVAAFLFRALQIDGIPIKRKAPQMLTVGEDNAFDLVPSTQSATDSAGSSLPRDLGSPHTERPYSLTEQVAPETVALKEKRINISGNPEGLANLRMRVRVILRGRLCLSLLLLALVLALYIPDVWVSIGAPTQTGADVILTTVMLMFLAEFTLLSLVDSTYPLSFFFFMDCIGTFTMIMDLSYLFGTSAMEPQSNQSSKEDLTLFRATRTAKIGARAGRLSRLVKVMKYFMPGNKGKHDAEQLHQISNQLTNVLSKRVACLTILLVIIMPLFTLGLYPEADFSMRVWLDALSRRVAARESADSSTERALADADLMATINEFSLFYQQKDYGPYRVCIRPGHVQSECYQLDSRFSQPKRINFQFDVSSDLVEASFDYSAPTMAEANMGITLISIVIVLMCGACLLLNYSASELAVKPFSKMLGDVKASAKAIFSSTASIEPKRNSFKTDDDDFDDQMDSEVALIERVVKKIATLVELSRQEHPLAEASVTDMKGEELGVLAMTTGTTMRKENSDMQEMTMGEEILEIGKAEVTMTMRWQLEEIGVEYELFNSLQFNALEIDPSKQKQISAWLLINNPGSSAFTENNIDMKCMRRFIDLISQEYLQKPYHNFMHALDVTHAVFRYMTFMCAEQIFSMQEQFSLLVAALSHDVGHPGFNTMFLREVQHELTIRYNDHSPLENMHCSKLFEIMVQSDVELFQSIPADQYREVRKLIIEVILHTDICQHPTMVKELELLYEMNSRVFEQTIGGILTDEEVEVLSVAQHKQLIAKVIVHSADISNPTKSWSVAKAWADAVLEEYFAQGDREKKLGIPVQILNDRDKVNQPISQIGFIEFIVAPLIAFQLKIFPPFRESVNQLDHNLKKWQIMWTEEAKPSPSEGDRVLGRVKNVSDMLSKVRKISNQTGQPARTKMFVRRASLS